MTATQPPLVSIGMPIYNAESSLHIALDALLGQDFTDFELVISDNASTDNTWAICQDYAARDSRIRLFRNETNLGVTANFEGVLERSRGKYFMWAAHDDYWEPTFIRACVAQLEANPDAALCYVRFVVRFLDENREYTLTGDWSGLRSPHAWERVETLLRSSAFPNNMVYGLFRRDILASIMPVPIMLGSDSILLLKTARLGKFMEVDQQLFVSIVDKWRPYQLRARQLGSRESFLTVLKWDWNLFWMPLTISQSTATSLPLRWRLFVSSLSCTHRFNGWPSPYHIFNRYSPFILPETVLTSLRTWYRKVLKKKR